MGLVRSVSHLQYKIHILEECCRSLATRLQISLLSSTIQLSPPQRSTDKAKMEVDLVPWQLTLHLGWVLT